MTLRLAHCLPITLAAALVATGPVAAQDKARGDPAEAQKARRLLDDATAESQRAEAMAKRAQDRMRTADARLRTAQAEVDAAHRDNQVAQQRASAARNAENRARRSLDAALPRSR